ncbi:MAG TPA: alpha/beta hydrolase [Acidimicrobiales bacterium]|nr:alpha/beta hydrolase [Acidimicrobiales bacterium]
MTRPSSTLVSSPGDSIIAAPVRVVTTARGQVSYRAIGSGTPLVMIMGFSGSMDSWEPGFLDALAGRYQVIIFDNAGIGRSTGASPKLTITDMADDTAALIKALGLVRPDVLGWSMGGMIAQALASKYPGDVNRLVLCATLPGNGKATLPPKHVQQALDGVGGGNILELLSLIFPANQTVAANAFIHSIASFPHLYLAPKAVISDQLHALASWLLGMEPAGRAEGTGIGAPTLVADGAEDAIVPVANDYELHSVVKGSQLVLYPDASHAFLFQDESSFLPRLEGFLG